MERNKGETIGIMGNSKGITLLALAVTIVVLLILTSIGLKLALGNNGIIGEAKNAKEQSEIDEGKGIVKRATTVSLIKSKGSKVEQDTLEKALDDETGEGKTEVSDVGDVFEVAFVDSNRYYEVDSEGKYVVLTRSLNFKSKHSYDDYTRTDFGNLNEDEIIEDIKTELTKKDENCMGFASIGQKTAFKGIFRGNINSIQNTYTKKYGLFSYIEGKFTLISWLTNLNYVV